MSARSGKKEGKKAGGVKPMNFGPKGKNKPDRIFIDEQKAKVKQAEAAIKAEKKKSKEEKEVIERTKALKKFDQVQVNAIQMAMTHLVVDTNNAVHKESIDHFGLLFDAGLVKGPMFSRTTGLPKLKKVLTKQGRDVFKLLYPSKNSPPVLTA